MRDEASLRRLVEMGVDVYLPRTVAATAGHASIDPALPHAHAHAHAVPDPPARVALAAPSSLQTPTVRADVLLLADHASPLAKTMLRDVARALKFAGITCAPASAQDEAALTAAALVMFGDAQARTVGALLPAQRQREIGWVVSAELPKLGRDAQAKRALWSELKRMTRGLADARSRTLAANATGVDHRLH